LDIAIQLYGYLLLTIVGIITPLIAVLLPIFSEGVLELTKQYKSEESRASENLKKIASADKTDLEAIEKSVKDLKKIQKKAQIKLSYLSPKAQIVRLFIILLLSFLFIIVYLISKSFFLNAIYFIIISVLLFILSLRILWGLLNVLIEARKVIDENKKDTNTQIIKLLTTMAEKTPEEKQPFLKDVYINLDGVTLKDDSLKIDIENNKEQKLSVEFLNNEKRMVKNLEIGLTFPFEFIIDKQGSHSIYSGDKIQIVRFQDTLIHGNTNINFGYLVIKPVKTGEYKIKTFIKAENIETIYRYVTVKVTEKAATSQIQKES
jgi:ABC-type multidrug transport system fused ATPase/permease subunit